MVIGAMSVEDTDVTTAEMAIDNTANENTLTDYVLRVDVPYAEGMAADLALVRADHPQALAR